MHSSISRCTTACTLACIAALLQGLAFAVRADTSAVYQWTDESGIVHYSQWPPESTEVIVEKRRIEVTNAPDYDPLDYRYSVQNQAERIGETWDAIREEKETQATERRLARAEERLADLERRASRFAAARPVYVSPFLIQRPHHRFHPFPPGGFRDRHRPRPPRRPPGVTDHGVSPGPGWTRPGSATAPTTPGFAGPDL